MGEAFERLKAATTERVRLIDRCAEAAREAYAAHCGDKEIVPWEQAKSRKAWRLVAEAVLEAADRG